MVKARKRFGQHFLEPAYVRKVVAAIDPRPDDVFVEIGPGHGALTAPLAERCRRVVAIEIDRDLAAALPARVPANVEVLQADILSTDLPGIVRSLHAPAVRAAGNLPYNISSPILFQLLETWRAAPQLVDATVMLQREVVDRLAAAPGSRDYGVLTVMMALDARIRKLLDLPPGAFRPPPAVRSAVVQLRFEAGRRQPRDREAFERMVRTVFMQRRKTLANALKPLAASSARVGAWLNAAAIDGTRRPETLSIDELVRLADETVDNEPSPRVSDPARPHRGGRRRASARES